MLQAWEIVVAIIMIYLVAFPLRLRTQAHRVFIMGILLGAIIGRLFYIFLAEFFDFDSALIKIAVMGMFAFLFVGVCRDFIKWFRAQ